MELIVKKHPINRQDDNKKIYYETNDNLLRFYHTYVYKNKSALQVIGAEAFYDEYISDSIVTFISHRFEEICRDYFSILVKSGKLKGIRDIGTYYYDDSVNKTNGEFDVVLKRKDSYEFYEAKYYQSPLCLSEMKKEESQFQIKELLRNCFTQPLKKRKVGSTNEDCLVLHPCARTYQSDARTR